MRICIVRDRYLNPWDAGNFYGLSAKNELIYCGRNSDVPWRELRELYPAAKFLEYGNLWDILELEPDIIDVPDTHYEFSQELIKRHDRVVVSVWDNVPGKNTFNPAALEAMRNASKFVARSKWARKALQWDGVRDEKIKIIPGAVDTKFFSPGVSPRQDVVLYVGRLVMEKGLLPLVWAVSQVPGVELWIAGEGPEKQGIKTWADKAGISGRTKWLGSLSRAKLADTYRRVRVVALPSVPVLSNNPYSTWVEQFGQVLIEAMASGVPIVGTDVGAIPEVGGTAGLYSPAMDWNKMAEHIDSLMADPVRWEKMATMARKRAQVHYDQVVVANKLMRWYAQ